MMEVDPAPIITSKDKGKGKMVIGELDTLPWVEKYRPEHLKDLVSHEEITETLKTFIERNRLPHLLFYGPPGTGKTSTIMACARQIYGDKFRSSILELNASDDRGIDVVREQIKNFASTRTIYSSGFKLIILDECDNMTQQAQSALRRVIEKYTKNVRFCIICNYVSKIIPAIQSRCTRFRFSPLELEQVESRLNYIVQEEHVNLTEDGKSALLRLSNGDMRRALNILQACHAGYDRVDETAIYNCTGNPHPGHIDSILDSMLKDEYTTAYQKVDRLKKENGYALQDIITDIYEKLQQAELPSETEISMIAKMADIEYHLGEGADEQIQLGSLIGSFKLSLPLV
ncbi:P-loop containing nucleoside triphosphate hydrolase protein [Halteromyces radiatus]|uniref:P-loop containing nucleoside triphosphate hydrolase protein n=1 Tax=Halteromyces radiatus TaxID=101107 RepID=UPI00221FB525|nr:P-loop containing nucleoside triphosphate hydrolase protein [Halteromyces radiatus]KAI8097771.1 P-loop containing nucleoside triphosphate hydrolase protein [Halteromyces radiatus]